MNPPAFDAGQLADVTCHETGDRWTLVFVRDLAHSPAAVWSALTAPSEISAWAPYTVDRDLGATGPVTLTVIDGDTRQPLDAEVLRADPPRLLEHTWGPGLVRWEIAPAGDGSRLTLAHTVADRDWVPKLAAGWHLCLLVAASVLDGSPLAPIRGGAARDFGWERLNRAYAQRLAIPVGEWPEERLKA